MNFLKEGTHIILINFSLKQETVFWWSYSVVVSTRDFESRDLGSNPSKT